MVNVKGALVSRDVFVVFGQWDMGTMQHMISGDGLPWNDPLAPIPQNRPAGFLACRQQIKKIYLLRGRLKAYITLLTMENSEDYNGVRG
jgi:hypothetical protein